MPRKINSTILREEIMGRVVEFYPYFLGFYLLSLAVALFSRAWSGLFYWPALHVVAALFTVLFLLFFEFDLRGGSSLRRVSIVKNIRIFRSFLSFKKNHLAELFVTANCFARCLFKAIVRSVNNKIRSVSQGTWVKIVVIAMLLTIASLKGIGFFNFLVLTYALVSLLFFLDSRWSAVAALFLLAFCPVLLALKIAPWAENTAVGAYYFLLITVITQIRESIRKNRPVDKRGLMIVVDKKRWYNRFKVGEKNV